MKRKMKVNKTFKKKTKKKHKKENKKSEQSINSLFCFKDLKNCIQLPEHPFGYKCYNNFAKYVLNIDKLLLGKKCSERLPSNSMYLVESDLLCLIMEIWHKMDARSLQLEEFIYECILACRDLQTSSLISKLLNSCAWIAIFSNSKSNEINSQICSQKWDFYELLNIDNPKNFPFLSLMYCSKEEWDYQSEWFFNRLPPDYLQWNSRKESEFVLLSIQTYIALSKKIVNFFQLDEFFHQISALEFYLKRLNFRILVLKALYYLKTNNKSCIE